ncbi:probable serine/threonine-protein kinase dyrk2 [Anopheles nili]|uniref:probable serine/threonine-protein kinase dyrk2 n=1 Tax=Anopheles nili TaxID=185578 RepID=UPI00237BFC77|nr:probable serine/threonine-protein kinase dyrk2 [Anopheles nili]
MIRDPGGANPNENLDSPPSPKYDRIIGRPPPLDDTETPLDMTVRRKDSSDGQGSPTGASGCDQSRDVPINLNVRPSVITKAPPPPIKKRISHMHTNGEIVLKSSVKTTSTTTVELSPIVNVSSTYCDVSIEEHFRRSLGPTYSSIYGDKQQLQQSSSLNMTNNNTSTNQVSFPLDPSMHHAQQNHPLPLPLLLQKHVMETSESLPLTVAATGVTTGGMRNHSSSSISSSSSVSSNSSSSSNSSCSSNSISKNISMRPTGSMSGGIRAVAPDTIELKLSSDPAPPIPLVPATVLPPSPGAPSPAAGLSNPTTVAISLTSPKHLHQQPPPPAVSPASLTTTMSLSSSSPSSSLASSPAPFLPISSQQHQKRPDSGEEVDDHFAKALGDTWKKIQENKMNL